MKGTACYIDFPKIEIAPEDKKGVLSKFWDLVHSGLGSEYEEYTFHTLDGGSVRGDLARVSRLPNTPHWSGLYCVPLEREDLDLSEGWLRIKARGPNYDLDLKAEIDANVRSNAAVMNSMIKELVCGDVGSSKNEPKMIMSKGSVSGLGTSGPSKRLGVTKEEILRARKVPISEIYGMEGLQICPLHKEGNASFSVELKKNVWYCHGCGLGGDVISLVERMFGYNFVQSVEFLINRR